MTVAMSSEGDSSKSVLSESNEKSGTDNNTDSSQDSHDVSEAKPENASVENDVQSKIEPEKPKEEKESEDKSPDKKVETEEKKEDERKAQTDTEEVESKENKKEKEKEEKKSENSEKDEEEEDEKDGKKEVPLLDQPLELSGKRERKNVQRLEIASEIKETKIEVTEGPGTPLGDIARVDASISRFKNEDLKLLHRLLFKVVGKTNVIKKNIRRFSGFDFKKDSEEYTKKVSFAHKYETKQLKSICEMLDLPKSGTKDDIIDRIIEFLMEPKELVEGTGRGRPKRTAAVKANNRGYSSHDDYSSDEKQSSRARRDKGKRTNLKDDSSSDEEFQPNQSDGSEDRPRVNKRKRKGQKKDSSEEEASEASVATSEESDDEPKNKRKKNVAKANNKTKAKGTAGKRGRPPATSKKTLGRGKKSKESSEEEEEEEESEHKEEEGSSSEDEPLAKKAKNTQPPTDDEIKTFIKGILDGANLEEITMKTVCQRVYGHYPDFDLTHKKDFIKSTVKSLIST